MIDQWQDRGLSDSLSSFDNFNRLLGLEPLQQYLFSRAVHKLPNWSAHPLDDQGKSLQIQMQSALDVSFHQARSLHSKFLLTFYRHFLSEPLNR